MHTHIGTVNSVLASDKQVSATKLELLRSILAGSNYSKRQVPCQAYLPNLRQVSETTGIAHTTFLAAPVSQCIVPAWQGSLLSRHHPPVSVTAFTLTSGPTTATECCLKCKKIYNYSMYGKKLKEGEQYYSETCQYTEVSDVVYRERQMFVLLR